MPDLPEGKDADATCLIVVSSTLRMRHGQSAACRQISLNPQVMIQTAIIGAMETIQPCIKEGTSCDAGALANRQFALRECPFTYARPYRCSVSRSTIRLSVNLLCMMHGGNQRGIGGNVGG